MVAVSVLACGPVALAGAPHQFSWPYPNANLDNTRVAAGSTITSHNVDQLKKAWSFTLSGKALVSVSKTGTLVAGPVVVNGVVYLQDMHSNVYAVLLSSGQLLWKHIFDRPLLSGPGPNGVAVAHGFVYGTTPRSVFSLNATTGATIWRRADYLEKGQGTFGIQPQVANGVIYLGSQYGDAPGGGVILALRASTGAVLWRFKTVTGDEANVTSVGLGAGGVWETPLVGPDGSVSFGTGNPYQEVGAAFSHPERLLYTNSVVNLDAATGRLRWYYQGVANDFKDYDMQASPILARVKGSSVIVGGGKMGIVYEMDARTGRLIWKTPVGVHDGHDDDSLRALNHESTPKIPFTYEPGSIGGVLTNMAVDGNTVYVATCNIAFKFSKASAVIGSPGAHPASSGDVEALNLTTGKVEWDTRVDGLPLGAVTIDNDLVFTTLLQGKLLALSRRNGEVLRSIQLPRTTNATIAIAGNTVLVPAGGPKFGSADQTSQLVAYSIP